MDASRLRLPYLGSARGTADADSESWRTQLRWFGAAAVVGFVVPYFGSSVLDWITTCTSRSTSLPF